MPVRFWSDAQSYDLNKGCKVCQWLAARLMTWGCRFKSCPCAGLMSESTVLASVFLLYLLLGEEVVRPLFLLLLLLLCFILTGSGWVAITKGVLVISSFCLLVLSRRRGSLIFLILVTLSSLLLVCSVNWLSVYLALELQALSLFVLVGLSRGSAWGTEASLKYFSLGALSSAFFLLGCVFFYGVTGEGSIQSVGGDLGKVFITIALLFKLSAAPFHMWAPDVYEGAPTSTAAVLAILPKVSVFSILIQVQPAYHLVLICSFISIILGALGALNQTRFKRLVAYSGVSHLGFVLFGFSIGSLGSLQASYVYLLAYVVMSLCLFSAFLTSRPRKEFLWGLSAVSRDNPSVALVLALVFLSTAGIPPLLGFLGKWLVLLSGLSSGYFQVSLVAVAFSVIAGFYYVRLVQLIYFPIDFCVLLWQRALFQGAVAGFSSALLVGGSCYFVAFGLMLPSLPLQFGFWATVAPC